jgi:uncharacterized membrane protein YhaH (DUF805 family)
MNLWFMLCLFVLGIFIMQIATSICIKMENDASHHSHGDLDPLYPIMVSLAFFGIFLSVTSIIKIVKRLEEQ